MARDKPRISLNQLAMYLTSDAKKRRRIIEEQKDPQTFRVNWYEYAQDKIVRFVAGGCEDEEILVAEIDRLYAARRNSDYEDTRYNTNAEALESFRGVYEDLNTDGLLASRGANDARKTSIRGVAIAVRPEILLQGKYRGSDVAGAIKLYFSKDTQLTDDSAAYITALLYQYMADRGDNECGIRRRHCQVIDVFGQAIYDAPAATKRRVGVIEEACEEIKMWWERV